MSNAINDYTQTWRNGTAAFNAHVTRLLTSAADGNPENAIGTDWSASSYLVRYGIDGTAGNPTTTCWSVDTVGNAVLRLNLTAGGVLTGNSIVSTTSIDTATLTATGAVQGASVASSTGDVTSAGNVTAVGNITTAAGSVTAPNIGQSNTSYSGQSITVSGNIGTTGGDISASAGNVSGTAIIGDTVQTKAALGAIPSLTGPGSVSFVSTGASIGVNGDYIVKTRTGGGAEQLLNVSKGLTPIGTISMWPTNTAPSDYMICDGRVLDTTTYADLFAILSYDYGGSGSSFNIPDYRGVFLRGTDNPGTAAGAAGIDPDAATRTDRGDGTTGNTYGTKQGFALQEHQHNVQDAVATVSTNQANVGPAGADETPSGNVLNAVVSTETRPVNTYINFIIKVL